MNIAPGSIVRVTYPTLDPGVVYYGHKTEAGFKPSLFVKNDITTLWSVSDCLLGDDYNIEVITEQELMLAMLRISKTIKEA